jgi:hypothetical protein
MTRFHDLAFNNKLYSTRRRYITQYVTKYPYPDPLLPASKALIALAKRLVRRCELGEPLPETSQAELDALVQEAFGLGSEEAPQ